MRDKIMYLECKDGGVVGPGRIGRVRFSKSGRTLYYDSYTLTSLRGKGYKANFSDQEEGNEWWISGPKRDGQDTLYPGIVDVDENVRVEYWTEIRVRPELVEQTSFRSEGKYSRKAPQPDKPNRIADGV